MKLPDTVINSSSGSSGIAAAATYSKAMADECPAYTVKDGKFFDLAGVEQTAKWAKRQRQKAKGQEECRSSASTSTRFTKLTLVEDDASSVAESTTSGGGGSEAGAWRLPVPVELKPRGGGGGGGGGEAGARRLPAPVNPKPVGGGGGEAGARRLPAPAEPTPKPDGGGATFVVGAGGGKKAKRVVEGKALHSGTGYYAEWPKVPCSSCGQLSHWRRSWEESVQISAGGSGVLGDDEDAVYNVTYYCAPCKAVEWAVTVPEAEARVMENRSAAESAEAAAAAAYL